MSNELEIRPDLLPVNLTSDVGTLAVAERQASVMQEIQGAMILAKRFPRDEKQAWSDLQSAVERRTLAEAATYSFPRGGTQVKGPSVNLARTAAYCWRNIRWGTDIIGDDGDTLTIESWAWDIERNIKKAVQDRFAKLIQRKVTDDETGAKITKWIKPDERDLRELVNRRLAITERNCLLQILPKDLIEDAMAAARQTVEKGIKDPAGESKRLILDFKKMGISAEQLNAYLGTDTWGAQDIADLKEILTSIKDGNSTRDDYFTPESKGQQSSRAKTMAADLAHKAAALKKEQQTSGPIADPTDEQLEKGEIFP